MSPNGKILLRNLFSFLLSVACVTMYGQEGGGMHIYAGPSHMSNASTAYTPEGQVHSGHHVGGDFILLGGGMYFMFGAQYHNTDLIPTDEHSLFDINTKLIWIKPRGGLGFTVLELTDWLALRAKALVSVDIMVHSLETAAIATNPPLNDGTASLNLGVGASIGPARVDVEYHKALFNAYNELKGTGYNFLLVNVGFFF